MPKFPAMPLFTDAWIADTKHLSHRERGIYMDLLILMWRTPGCRVPDDKKWLSMRLSLKEADKDMSRVLGEFFSKARGSGGKWLIQKRLAREFNYLSKKRVLRSRAAKSRWDKEKKHANAMLTPPHPTYDSNNPPKPPLAKGGPSASQMNGKEKRHASHRRPRQLSSDELIEGARALRAAREKAKG